MSEALQGQDTCPRWHSPGWEWLCSGAVCPASSASRGASLLTPLLCLGHVSWSLVTSSPQCLPITSRSRVETHPPCWGWWPLVGGQTVVRFPLPSSSLFPLPVLPASGVPSLVPFVFHPSLLAPCLLAVSPARVHVFDE